jgi:hypothetical protein
MTTSQHTDAEGRIITQTSTGPRKPGGMFAPVIAFVGMACIYVGAFYGLWGEPTRTIPLGFIGVSMLLWALFNVARDLRAS